MPQKGKKLVESVYADLQRTNRQFCNCSVTRKSHLLTETSAVKPQSLTEAVQAGNEYLQVRPNTNLGVTIWQVKEEEVNPKPMHVAQSKPYKMKVLLYALRQLTSEVASLTQTQKATATKPKK